MGKPLKQSLASDDEAHDLLVRLARLTMRAAQLKPLNQLPRDYVARRMWEDLTFAISRDGQGLGFEAKQNLSTNQYYLVNESRYENPTILAVWKGRILTVGKQGHPRISVSAPQHPEREHLTETNRYFASKIQTSALDGLALPEPPAMPCEKSKSSPIAVFSLIWDIRKWRFPAFGSDAKIRHEYFQMALAQPFSWSSSLTSAQCILAQNLHLEELQQLTALASMADLDTPQIPKDIEFGMAPTQKFLEEMRRIQEEQERERDA